MSLTLILTLSSLSGYGAKAVRDTISLNLQEVKLERFVEVMKQKTGLNFLYNSLLFKDAKLISVTANGENWESVLRKVLEKEGFTYDVKDEIVVIKRKVENDHDKLVIVKGQVVDSKKEPLPGVTVLLKGMTIGTVTDSKGNFSIRVPQGVDSLIVSFIGMQTEYLRLEKDKLEYTVVMKEDVTQLGEVVVTGYQEFDKTRMAGSVSSIKAEDLHFSGTNTLEQALQGRLPGVVITNTSGLVGVRQKTRVRGTSTLLGSQEPIWVVDGIIQEDPLPFDAQTFNSVGEINSDNFDYIRNFVGSSISWLNPSDIESITVLKDASSTAIYGVRAANGVIVIKTKRGKTGAASIFYSASLNVAEQVTYDKLELMNSKERVAVSREIFQRGLTASWTNNNIGYAGVLKQYLDKEISGDEFERRVAKLETTNTDWFDILFRNPFSHNHSISVSGGSEDIRYYTSLSYNSTKGTAVGNDSESYGANVGLDMTVTNKFRASFSLSGSHGTTKGFTIVNPYEYATKTNRAIAAYEDNGDLSYYQKESGYLFNIINERDESGTSNKTFSLNSNLNLNYDFTESLKFQMLGSVNVASVIGEAWATERTEYIAKIRWYDYGVYKAVDAEYKNSQLPVGGEYSQDENKSVSWNWRNSLSYDKVFNGKHALTTMLGVELSSTKNTGYSSTTYGYLKYRGKSFAQVPIVRTNPYGNTQSANELLEKFTRKITDKKTNQFGAYLTMNYAYDGKYVVNFSVRLDASNRFGRYANENFNPVWAGGLRWNVSRETWFNKQNIVSDLSLRFSYGYQRNMATNYSPSLIVKVPTGSASEITDQNTGDDLLEISSLPYEDLRWEKTSSYNYGVDMGLFQNKIRVGFEYYLKKGKDMITSLLVPREYGIENMPVNGGSMNNSGWELSVSFTPVRTKNFTWDMGLNTSKNNNKITEVGIQNLTWRTVVGGEYYKKGYPVSSFWAFDCEGIDQQTGYPIINLDVHDGSDPLNDPTAYMRYAGKLDPDFTGGLTMSFRYKQLSLSTNFYLQVGGKKFLMTAYESQTLPSEYENLSSELNNRWKPGDTNAKFPGLPDKNVVNSLLPDTKTYTNVYEMYNYSNVGSECFVIKM
jgi:tonB-linked outer membrane protein, susC/ragA family